MKRVFLYLSVVGIVLVATAAGLSMSPYLAKRLGFASFRQATAEREVIPAKMAEIIGAAKESVVLATETFDSMVILEALSAAGARQLQVSVVLSGPANKPSSAGVRYLTQKGIPVRFTQDEFHGLILVSDKKYAAICSTPVVSSQKFSSAQATLFVFEHKPTASSYFERIRLWKTK